MFQVKSTPNRGLDVTVLVNLRGTGVLTFRNLPSAGEDAVAEHLAKFSTSELAELIEDRINLADVEFDRVGLVEPTMEGID